MWFTLLSIPLELFTEVIMFICDWFVCLPFVAFEFYLLACFSYSGMGLRAGYLLVVCAGGEDSAGRGGWDGEGGRSAAIFGEFSLFSLSHVFPIINLRNLNSNLSFYNYSSSRILAFELAKNTIIVHRYMKNSIQIVHLIMRKANAELPASPLSPKPQPALAKRSQAK